MAFTGGDWVGVNDLPKAGDLVRFQRYAGGGEPIELADGNKYRIIADADLKGVYDERIIAGLLLVRQLASSR